MLQSCQFSHLLGEEPLEERRAASRPRQFLEAVLQLPDGVVVSRGQLGLVAKVHINGITCN